MIAHLQEWFELLARWFHVIVGAAWIGTSFYFNWLNNNLREPDPKEGLDAGIGGQLWAVHGGGFYRVLKYREAPGELPETLHWFKWEAYLTWVSGFTLLCLVYYFGSDGMLMDPAKPELSKLALVGIGLFTLIGGWIGYDQLCKSSLRDHPLILQSIGFLAIVGVAYGLCQVMSSRAAYIHVGAMLGTCMAANVFFVIIPGQRDMVDAMNRGELPDASRGKAGGLRSLHNNYFTLPVLFIMISSHYPMTYTHEWNWALLVGFTVAGAAVRHWFNLRGQGHRNAWLLPVATLVMVALTFVTKPAPPVEVTKTVSFAEDIHPIVQKRCVTCHAAKPSFPGYIAPPGGVVLETPEQIKGQAQQMLKHAVLSNYMPLGNLTKITEEERAMIGQWVRSGAPLKSGD